MATDQLSPYQLLLETFGLGVKTGVITPAKIIAWADEMIMAHDEPDYFFIELSLSGNKNEIIEVINRRVVPSDNPICTRVLLGCIYRRFTDDSDTLSGENAATMVGELQNYDTLTGYEVDQIYEFYDYDFYYLPDITKLQVELINFLSLYEAFTLENYKQWVDVNLQVLELLKEEEIQVNIVNESFRKEWAKKEKKRKLKFYLKNIGVAVLLLLFFSLMIALLADGKTNPFTFYTIVFYWCLRLVYGWWKGRKKFS